jgi:hypothetical protein
MADITRKSQTHKSQTRKSQTLKSQTLKSQTRKSQVRKSQRCPEAFRQPANWPHHSTAMTANRDDGQLQ